MKQPVRIAVTGAAGQIGYATLFRIAAGEMLGPDQPVILQLLELPQALSALQGVVMELEDCAFPLLQEIITGDDPNVIFKDVDYALLIGSRPRSKGMERSDLLSANAEIFSVQGKALNTHAKKTVKVLVVGNPANTNALITQHFAPSINPHQIHSMMRLDHNRAVSYIARKVEQPIAAVKHVAVWGNHSATQYPDLFHANVQGKHVSTLVNQAWIADDFIPTVQKRGAAIIEARGASSAASAANAAISHIRNWVLGTPGDDWVSMGVPSDGSYGIAPGLIFGFPCRCVQGEYHIIKDLVWNDFTRDKILASQQELLDEKEAISHLLK